MKLYNININIEENNIGECKKKIKEAINKKNMEELSDEIKSKKKTQKMINHDTKYIRKENFKNARQIFMILSDMIEVKTNYKGSHKNTICEICKTKEENTQHLIECEGYKDITKDLKGRGSIEDILKMNTAGKITQKLEKIMNRRELLRSNPRKENNTPAPLLMGCSLPDGRTGL